MTNFMTLLTMTFQSTLPHGSDKVRTDIVKMQLNFNPRSLTGATLQRQLLLTNFEFQSTLPHGKKKKKAVFEYGRQIGLFQSTLPHGSDGTLTVEKYLGNQDFNPRSLTGAT